MRSIFLIVVAGLALVGCDQPKSAEVVSQVVRLLPEPGAAKQAVAFHQSRVSRDPGGAMGWAMLADAALELANTNDDDKAAELAETAARQSLKLRRSNNGQAALSLTKSLLAQHRFREAQTAIQDAAKIDPANSKVWRLGMEIKLELGQYAEFKREWPRLSFESDPASLLLRARWHNLTGQPEQAVKLVRRAVDQVEEIATLDAATVSWYHVQLANTFVQADRPDEAERTLAAALELNPRSHQAWGARARLAADAKDWKSVLAHGTEASKEAKLTDIQGLMIQAERALGKRAEADKRLAELIEANGGPAQFRDTRLHDHDAEGRHTHNRLFAMALTDLGLHLRFAHHLAEEDLKDRPDIHAEHAFAWTTYRYWLLTPPNETGEGDFLRTEAQAAMKRALQTGSRDPQMLRHAQEIFAAKPK